MSALVIIWLAGAVVWASMTRIVTDARTRVGLLAVTVGANLVWPVWIVMLCVQALTPGRRRGH